MGDSYDAIVVGAGLAGSAAAYIMAQAGLEVALLERGDFPGAKNVYGGTIYRLPTEEIIPAFWKEAPLERPVVTDELWLADNDSAVKIGFTGLRYAKEPYNKFVALRSKFDPWLANKAAQAGAEVRTKALVRHLLYEKTFLGKKGKVIGVKLDDGEELMADVVILAEGVNAFLTKEAGLRSEIPAHTTTLYVREILNLPAEKIEERFNLEKGHGAIIGIIGTPLGGAVGKAGIYTNKESLSLIVGAYLNQLAEKGLSPYELLWRIKSHPLVKKLLEGAVSVEYQAHLIPKGGFAFIPKLYRSGLLVTGDAAVMVSGRHGTDLAMLTGKLAAETVIQAKAKGDFSEKMLSIYSYKLSRTYFVQDIKDDKKNLEYYQKRQDSDYLIASTANELAYQFFNEEMLSNRERQKKLLDIIESKQFPFKTLADIYEAYKHWGVF